MASKKAKKIIVAGSFDVLHPGHIKFLEWVKKKFKGRLIIVLARNESIEKMKGRKAVFSERERKILLEAIRYVDKVIIGDKKDFLKPLLKEKPDIIVLGYDQWANEEYLEKKLRKSGLYVKIVRAPAFNEKRWKSKRIIERIVRLFGR